MIKLEKNEKIILEIRKHWVILVLELMVLLVMAVIPLLLLISSNFIELNFIFQANNYTGTILVFIFLYCTWLLGLWIFSFIAWTNYYFDAWFLTTDRLIDVEQHSLFTREISTLKIDRIQDVTFNVGGLFETLLGIGSITVQTAGSDKFFTIKGIKDPEKVNQEILKSLGLFEDNLA